MHVAVIGSVNATCKDIGHISKWVFHRGFAPFTVHMLHAYNIEMAPTTVKLYRKQFSHTVRCYTPSNFID